jgi:hypothetical protein
MVEAWKVARPGVEGHSSKLGSSTLQRIKHETEDLAGPSGNHATWSHRSPGGISGALN